MKKVEPKRYSLVYGYPSSDNLHVIDFKKDKAGSFIWNDITVPKGKDIVKGKHTLAEIDMFTNNFNSFEQFNNLVLRRYFDDNPGNTYILYKCNGYNSLNVHYGNKKLLKNASLVKNSTIENSQEINEMSEMLLDIKSKFLQFLTSNLEHYSLNDRSVLALISGIRSKLSFSENSYYDELDIYSDKLDLKDKLSRYKLYREIFIAKQDYLEHLEELNPKPFVSVKSFDGFTTNQNGQIQMFETNNQKKLIKKQLNG